MAASSCSAAPVAVGRPVDAVDDDTDAATAAAIAASLNADAPGVSAADAAAIQRAMYEEPPYEPMPDAEAFAHGGEAQSRPPTVKHALFYAANSSNHFELSRTPVGADHLATDVGLTAVKLAMSDEQHAHLDGRIKSSTIVFSALGNCLSNWHKSTYQDCADAWPKLAVSAEALSQLRWDVLAICLLSNDPVGTQHMWYALRADCPDETGPKMPNAVRERLFSRDNVRETTLIRMLSTVICTCRKPRLGLLMLECLHREAVCRQSFSCSGRRDLAAIAVAIGDGVFGSDKARQVTYEQDHETWVKSFVDRAPKPTAECPCVPDKATDLDAWKRLVYALFDLVGDAMPERIMERLTRDRQYTLGMLQMAVRLSDHDTFFLREVLGRKHWSGPTLSEAYTEALHPYQGVRGPNLPEVLGMLYAQQLMEWRCNQARRSKQTVSSVDDLAKPWATVISSARGYFEIDIDGHNTICMPSNASKNGKEHTVDPAIWWQVINVMVSQHDPDPNDINSGEWDKSSPLFASLVRVALRACLGNKEKTHMVELFLQLSLANSGAFFATLWHDLPRVVLVVAEDHAELFPLLVKSMLTDAPPDMLKHNAGRFHSALGAAIFASHREPSRLIVQALRSARIDLPATIANDHTDAPECTLGRWVRNLGAGVSAAERQRHGSDYAAFVNARVEKDLVAVLEGAEWSEAAKTSALLAACTAKRAVVAQVLMRPPFSAKVPASRPRDSWLDAITQYLYSPGNAGARAVVGGLATQAQTLDSLAPTAAPETAPDATNKRDADEDDLAPPVKSARVSD